VPGSFDVWDDFQRKGPSIGGPTGGIGNPDEVRANLEKFEEADVDQVVFIQQGGRNRHEHICESLELFAGRVLPGFKERHEARERRKEEALAPYVARALERMPPLAPMAEVPEVESYPVLMQKAGIDITEAVRRGRPLLGAALAGTRPASA
jgi:hypothetical protein